ncbi:IclR family transcriptional regulator [Microvirga flavescens]|uniref:IclR family transcriptional regulator n=1 Tax=Microvirga flavescens TaxID=2249811 RepID=UPI000DD9DAB2|nr:helix-turn-helix domain-containing protein [Microvirga flavescens]
MNKKSSSNVQRAAEILIALGSAGGAGMSLASLATVIGDTKSAVHRALVSLAEFGLVSQTGRRGNYRLGPAIYALANRTPSINDMVTSFRPVLISISAETGLSSYLMVEAGQDSICLDFQPGVVMAPALVDGVGGRVPLGIGLAGVCILGMMDEASRKRIMEINEPQYESWGVDPAVILGEIEAFHEKGYAVGYRTARNLPSLTIALPAKTEDFVNCKAAVSVLAPMNGLDDEEIEKVVSTMRRYLTPGLEKKAVR